MTSSISGCRFLLRFPKEARLIGHLKLEVLDRSFRDGVGTGTQGLWRVKWGLSQATQQIKQWSWDYNSGLLLLGFVYKRPQNYWWLRKADNLEASCDKFSSTVDCGGGLWSAWVGTWVGSWNIYIFFKCVERQLKNTWVCGGVSTRVRCYNK